ncbi:MAG: OsmC family peroxiredoxin, partial [Eudoraea sp.]
MTSKVTYIGELRTSCIHLRSGNEIITDAPVDNNGLGQA